MRISGIYQIQSKIHPDRIYIGSAADIQQRRRRHLKDLRKSKHHSIKLQNHFNKYGEQDLQFSLVLECDIGVLIHAEQAFIDHYDPWFNICKIAGCSAIGQTPWNKGKHLSEETKRKIGEKNKDREFSEGHRRNLSEAHIGQIPWNKGKQWSKESKRNMSKAHKGPKPWTRKPVLQYDLGDNFIKEWPSKIEASLTLGINKNNISSCLTNNRGTAGGFIWKRKIVA